MKTLMDGVQREFEAIGDAQLIEDVVQVVLYRLLADEHLLGHFLVLVALRDQLNDFALSGAQRRPLARLARSGTAQFAGTGELPHHRSRGVRIEPDLAAVHLANAFDDELRRGLLQYDTRAAELHGLDKLVLVLR